MLSFTEFSELFAHNKDFRSAFSSLYTDIKALNRRGGRCWDSYDRSDVRNAWLRLPALQTSLLDLLDFLDPPPQCRFVPSYRRKRVFGLPEENVPAFVRDVVDSMARIRDGRTLSKLSLESLNIFVRGRTDGKADRKGGCPYSQTVLFALEEMKTPYSVHIVPYGVKPRWFQEIIPIGEVPIILHDSKIFEHTGSMLMHLSKQKPSKKGEKELKLCGSEVELAVHAVSDMHSHFREWIREVGLAADPSKPNCTNSLNKAGAVLLRDLTHFENILLHFTNRTHQFLGGKSPCIADFMMAPTLHHLDVVTKGFAKGSGVDGKSMKGATRRYLRRLYRYEPFKNSKPSDEVITEGYQELLLGKEPAKQEHVVMERNY